PFNQILKQNAKREMRLRLGKVTVADVLAAQPVTTNLLKFMRASIKMIGVSNLQSFIASMTQKLTLSDISDESKNYLEDRKSGSAGMPRPISYAVFCLKKKKSMVSSAVCRPALSPTRQAASNRRTRLPGAIAGGNAG